MEGNYKKWLNRFNSKQDILTEDNVGQFMDVKLSTKSTPTSGDTVLGRDSLTGKAVEIPTSSFGGGGSGSGLVLGETESTAYRGDRGKIAYDHSQITHDKNLVGLGNVDNTSDLNKPISTATQTALNNKQDKLTNPITGTGTTNKISKFIANGVIGDSIIYENNNSISIGDDVSDARLRVKAQGSNAADIVLRVRNSANTSDFLVVNGTGDVYNKGAQGVASNTFFGENVGRNTTGGNNTALGYNAFSSNTLGIGNSAFGDYALSANTLGTGNSAFGNYSLSANTTGENNIAIGSSAGRSISDGTPLINATSSVFVGCNTKSSKNGNTNEIVIGQSAIGNGSNTATIGNDSTTDVYLKGITNSYGFKTPNGTPNQALTANGGVFDLNLKLSTEAPSTTGTVISFSTDKVYGTLTTPETGNITADVTNAKLGVTNIIIHNSGTAPTFGSQFKKLSGSGNYATGVVNYIYCTYISATEIIYSINQRA